MTTSVSADAIVLYIHDPSQFSAEDRLQWHLRHLGQFIPIPSKDSPIKVRSELVGGPIRITWATCPSFTVAMECRGM